jgi:hypothetical protein
MYLMLLRINFRIANQFDRLQADLGACEELIRQSPQMKSPASLDQMNILKTRCF